ncbi:TAN1 tRNA acetyltransferase TAN1 [Candida maltosa Xu316]|uniref:tRNA acetyltransferase, putative n=1 Tax=Candida maltosa (strain Xu316) TaxID=1245528 RepID=M3IML5_CANMX|nr:tRNA acetyltransferase, putative [Candida maltosa Xu316]
MGKRKADGSKQPGKKKFKSAAKLLDPYTSGIYVTCARHKEPQCRQELMNILSEKIPEYFDLDKVEDGEDEEKEVEKKELSVEDKIKLELEQLKESKTSKKELLQPIEIDLECLSFIKTKKPIDPEVLVENICKECYESGVKTTRYTQKLIPIMSTCSATGDDPLERLREMAKKVLARHFHQEKDQKPVKFAINVSRRNFNTLESGEIIRTVAECIGKEHGHAVDLKNYDKLIIIECYKNSIGMGVANNYLKYSKFNLQQIFEKQQESKD